MYVDFHNRTEKITNRHLYLHYIIILHTTHRTVLLRATSVRKVSRRTCTSNAICTRCTRRRRGGRAKSATRRVRTRRFSRCTWQRTTRANRFRAKIVAKTLRASTTWTGISNTLGATVGASSNSCRARCAARRSRGSTICASICACTWGSRRGAENTNVRSVRSRFMGRRC